MISRKPFSEPCDRFYTPQPRALPVMCIQTPKRQSGNISCLCLTLKLETTLTCLSTRQINQHFSLFCSLFSLDRTTRTHPCSCLPTKPQVYDIILNDVVCNMAILQTYLNQMTPCAVIIQDARCTCFHAVRHTKALQFLYDVFAVRVGRKRCLFARSCVAPYIFGGLTMRTFVNV